MELKREASAPVRPSWLRSHAAGVIACALGLVALAVIALIHLGGSGELTRIPDPRITTPFLIGVLGAAIASFVRREGTPILPIAGIAMAACAMVLGWALIVAVIAAVTLLIIILLSGIM